MTQGERKDSRPSKKIRIIFKAELAVLKSVIFVVTFLYCMFIISYAQNFVNCFRLQLWTSSPKSKKVTEVTFWDYISNPSSPNLSKEESPSIMSKRSLCSMLYAPLSNFALSSLA